MLFDKTASGLAEDTPASMGCRIQHPTCVAVCARLCPLALAHGVVKQNLAAVSPLRFCCRSSLCASSVRRLHCAVFIKNQHPLLLNPGSYTDGAFVQKQLPEAVMLLALLQSHPP